jgi:hypothetical protein
MRVRLAEVRGMIEHFVLRLILVETGDTDGEVESCYEAIDKRGIKCPPLPSRYWKQHSYSDSVEITNKMKPSNRIYYSNVH